MASVVFLLLSMMACGTHLRNPESPTRVSLAINDDFHSDDLSAEQDNYLSAEGNGADVNDDEEPIQEQQTTDTVTPAEKGCKKGGLLGRNKRKCEFCKNEKKCAKHDACDFTLNAAEKSFTCGEYAFQENSEMHSIDALADPSKVKSYRTQKNFEGLLDSDNSLLWNAYKKLIMVGEGPKWASAKTNAKWKHLSEKVVQPLKKYLGELQDGEESAAWLHLLMQIHYWNRNTDQKLTGHHPAYTHLKTVLKQKFISIFNGLKSTTNAK